MNDPSVEKLYYTLKLTDDLSFNNPPVVEEDFPFFTLNLDKGILEISMKESFTTEAQARTVVEPYLRAWELDTILQWGRKEFWFEFSNSIIVDRNPTPPDNSHRLMAGVGEISLAVATASLKVTRVRYPIPPKDLAYSPDVESMLKRYEAYVIGKEPLLGMAFFCLTLIQTSFGSPAKSANEYKIDLKVLKKLGEITTERGDRTEARKVRGRTEFIPLTEFEKNWVTTTVKRLIRRKAEYDFNPDTSFEHLTMKSLPPLQ